MEWSDHGIVLSSRPHGETGLVVALLTRTHGRHAGFVPGGVSRKSRPTWQTGNVVEVELAREAGRAARQLQRRVARGRMPPARWTMPIELAGLSAACALVDAALPEREPHPAMFDGFQAFLSVLGHPGWPAIYVRLELGLLQELGFGLDLEKCALTGATEDLAFVSPKTGRAVSRTAAEPYRDKLIAAAGLSIHRRPAGRCRRAAAGPRFDGLFPRAPRVLATQQALACRAGEIYGNAATAKNNNGRGSNRGRPPHVAVDGQTHHQRRSARRRQAGAIRTGAPGALPVLCAVDDHGALAAGRARRAEAGASPPDVRDAPAPARPQQRLQEERARGRRRDRPVPPARRPVDLRRAGAPRAGILRPLSADRGAGQLRQYRRR